MASYEDVLPSYEDATTLGSANLTIKLETFGSEIKLKVLVEFHLSIAESFLLLFILVSGNFVVEVEIS